MTQQSPMHAKRATVYSTLSSVCTSNGFAFFHNVGNLKAARVFFYAGANVLLVAVSLIIGTEILASGLTVKCNLPAP